MVDKSKDPNAQANTKQKVTVVALILVVVFVGYQVMGLMGSGNVDESQNITPTTAPTDPASAGGGQMTSGAPAATTGSMPGSPPAAVAGPQAPIPAPVAPVNPGAQAAEGELIKLQEESQAKILESINTLQMLKIQREIAEMSQAIAAARLATVTAEKSISDVLTKPTLPDIPPSAYAERLSGGPLQSGTGNSGSAGAGQEGGQETSEQTAAKYVLLSVSMQFSKWSAVLGYKGKLYHVSVGDILSADGSTVLSISKDSVMLEKEGVKTKLSMVSSI